MICEFNMWTEATLWRVFNILARVFGLVAVAVAFGFVASAAYFVVHREATRNVETAGLAEGVVYAVGGAIAGAIAAFVLTRRPYRPDLGDAAFSDLTLRWVRGLPSNWTQSTPRRESVGRSWWTGDIRNRDSI
jgi:hypothetical protein